MSDAPAPRRAGVSVTPGHGRMKAIFRRTDNRPGWGRAVRVLGLATGLALLASGDRAHGRPALNLETSGGLITLRAVDVPIRDILTAITRHARLAVKSYARLDERVSVDVRNRRLPEVIHRLLKRKNFVLRYRPVPSGPGRGRFATLWIYPDSGAPAWGAAAVIAAPSPPSRKAGDRRTPGGEPVPLPGDTANSNDLATRLAAVAELEERAGDESVHGLAAFLGDDSATVREAAVEALGVIGGDTALRLIADTLGDADPGVRRAAAEALGDADDAGAVRALETVAHNPDPALRALTIEILTDTATRHPHAPVASDSGHTRGTNTRLGQAADADPDTPH